MEVINFKTQYSIYDRVYIVDDGNVCFGKITAVVFRGDGYLYDIEIGKGDPPLVTTVRRKEGEIFITLETAVNFAVEEYRQRVWNDWGYEVRADGTVKSKRTTTPPPDGVEGMKIDEKNN